MFRNLANAFKNSDIRKKLLITIALLFIYRLGCWLPIPGINAEVFASTFTGDNANVLLGLMSQIGGNALQNGALLAIGISPYINASIIIQLLTVAIPPLERLSKQGEEGRNKITQITRISTLVLAAAQAIGIAVTMYNTKGAEGSGLTGIQTDIFGNNTPVWITIAMVVVIMVAGSMFTMWLGERITDHGVGNGISMIIFVGILSTAGQSILAQLTAIFGGSASENNEEIWDLIIFFALVILLFTLIVLVDLAERRVPIQYAKQIKGRKQYGGQSTNIPIKLNASGVLPIIFATALITFPQIIAQIATSGDSANSFYLGYQKYFGVGTWGYSLVVGLLIIFFSYFYAQIQFNPDEVARNIQQYGGFIPGIRPGKPTSVFLGKISKRLTLFGALYLAILATIPAIIFNYALSGNYMLVNAFTATGMMIVVSVALEFDKQLESLLMMKQYKGFLK